MKNLIALALLLASPLQAVELTVNGFFDTLVGPFQGVSGEKPGSAALGGFEIDTTRDGLGFIGRYTSTLGDSHFHQEDTVNSWNGSTLMSPRQISINFNTSFQSLAVGLRVRRPVSGKTSYGTSFLIGYGQYVADYPGYHVTFVGEGFTYDGDLNLEQRTGNIVVGCHVGVLQADAMMRAQGNHYLGSGSEPDIRDGSTIQGVLRYSGLKIGLNLGMTF